MDGWICLALGSIISNLKTETNRLIRSSLLLYTKTTTTVCLCLCCCQLWLCQATKHNCGTGGHSWQCEGGHTWRTASPGHCMIHTHTGLVLGLARGYSFIKLWSIHNTQNMNSRSLTSHSIISIPFFVTSNYRHRMVFNERYCGWAWMFAKVRAY